MNLFDIKWERLFSRKRQPDYCALVEGAVVLARSTSDPKLLLAGLADQMGRALQLPRLAILLNQDEWTCAAEHTAAGLNATTRDRLRLIEAELARQLAAETAPVQVALADLKPALRASLEQAFENTPAAMRPRWLVYVPLSEGKQVAGAVLSYHLKRQGLADAQRHALQTLAAVFSFALYHQRSLERASSAAQREESTHQLLAAIRNAGSVEEVLKAAVDGLGRTLGVSRVLIFMSDLASGGLGGPGQSLEARAEYRQSALVPSLMGSGLDLSNAMLNSRLLAGEFVVLPDTGNGDALSRAPFVRLGVRALVVAPLAYKGETVGALALEQFDHPRRFTSEELRLIRLVAEQMATAIDNVSLYHEAQENARREALIRRINAAIHRSLDADVLQSIVNELGTALGVCRCRLALLPDPLPDSLPITHEYIADCCKLRKPPFTQVPTANNVMLRALMAADEPIIIEDPLTDPRLGQARRHYREAEVKSIMFASIRYGGRPIGVFSMHYCEQAHRWTASEIAIAQSVAEQAAVALRQSDLYKEVRESATRAALINQIIHGINQSNRLDEIFPIVAEQLGRHLAADRLTITRRYEESGMWVSECEYSDGRVSRARRTFPDADTGSFNALLEGDVIRCDDAVTDSRLTLSARALLGHAGTRSFATVRVAFDGDSQLTINAIMRAGPRKWNDEEVELMCAVANQVRVALQRAELFDLVSKGKFEWEATFDALTDGIFIFDENGIVRRVNQTAAALESTSVDELIGRECCTLLQGTKGEVCRVSQVLETNRPHTYELIPERLNRPVLVTIAPLGTGFEGQIDGEPATPSGAVCIVRELSELRAAEAVAREQRNFLVKLIEHANDSIFALSPNGRLIWFNEQLMRQSGFSRETLRSVSYLDCVPDSEKPQIAERFRRALAGAAQSFEIRTFRRNSESRLMLMTFTPIYDEGGVTSVLSIARDITEERLASERAAQADKLRALGQLASGVAHNFNNILAAILGHAQLMKREATDERLMTRLDIIENAALDGAQTVKRIQGFGLQQSNEAYETFDVNQLVQDSTTLTRARWQHEAQARGLAYDVTLDLHGVTQVRGAASELREVFVNIILNALDAMPQGGRLRITSKQKNGHVRIAFSDSGLGMTREVRQRIFEPFFTTKGVTGMGLGLAVSYSIIERHGGEIDVRSIPGRGTTFTISLPTSRVVNGVTLTSDSIMAKTARVLVVDDDDRVRDVLVGMLKLAGHRADFAPNGREALLRLEHESFDLVFTDLSMPDVDGWALAEEIRRRWPQLKIVMVTGYALQAESDRRRYQFVNDIISKPIRFDDINATLSHVLA
jgi:PAS domain S-box-containing protein